MGWGRFCLLLTAPRPKSPLGTKEVTLQERAFSALIFFFQRRKQQNFVGTPTPISASDSSPAAFPCMQTTVSSSSQTPSDSVSFSSLHFTREQSTRFHWALPGCVMNDSQDLFLPVPLL